jgi:hypothetical protein
MFHEISHPGGITPLGTGKVAMTDVRRGVAAVATPPSSTWKTFHLLINLKKLRLWFITVMVTASMFIGYWDTISNHWGDRTRSAAAASAVELGQEFYCTMHPQVIQAESDPQGESPRCRICGMSLSIRTKGGHP